MRGDLKRRNVVIIAVLSGWSVITVSDIQGFIKAGGIIGLMVENKKVRFEINIAAAEQSGLKISSKQLSLASTVRTWPSGN